MSTETRDDKPEHSQSTSEAKSPANLQRFWLRLGGHHYVATTSGRITTTVELQRDGEHLLRGISRDDHDEITDEDVPEKLDVRRTRTGRVKRVTLHAPGKAPLDMEPEAGSKAARRLERERAHPWRYAALDVLVAILGVLVPLLGLGALFKLLVAPLVEWLLGLVPDVDLPDVPWPDVDVPSIPWPDFPWPDIPWPRIDLSWIPDWTPPAWLVWLLDHLDDAKPVIIAAIFAIYEVRRRRRQDEERQRVEQAEREDLLARLAADLRLVAAGEGSGQAGQGDGEPGTPQLLGLVDHDRAAMGPDDLPHDRQPQA